MTIQKHQIILSNYVVSSKDEANDKVPIFMSQLKKDTLPIKELSLKQIKNKILAGYSFNVGSVKDKTILVLDIDNANLKTNPDSNILDINNIIKILTDIDLNPNLIFKTMGYKDTHPKYRVIISLDKPIEDGLYKSMLSSLITHINKIYPNSTDLSGTNTTSIFYPAKECVYEDLNIKSSTNTLFKFMVASSPDNVITLNLSKFWPDILYSNNLITNREYQNLVKKDIKLYIYQKSIKKAAAYIYQVYSINYKIVDIYYSYVILKRHICKNIFTIDEVFEDSFKPVLSNPKHINAYPYNEISKGVVQNLIDQKDNIFIKDILKEHKDSYSNIQDNRYKVYFKKDDSYVLKKNYNVIDFLCRLLNNNPKAPKGTLAFFLKLFNISLENNNLSVYKRNYSLYHKALDTKISNYKYLNEILNCRDEYYTKDILQAIIDVTKETIDKRIEAAGDSGKYPAPQIPAIPSFINKYLSKKYRPEELLANRTLRKKIIILAELGLINFVNKSEYNNHILDFIQKNKKDAESIKVKNIISIPHYTEDLFKKAEKIAKYMIENHFSTANANKNEKLIYESPIFQAGNDYIEKHINDYRCIARVDISNFYRKLYPEKSNVDIANIVIKYLGYFMKKNNLKETTLKKHNAWRYGLTKEIIEEKGYKYNISKIYYKEKA